MNLWIWRGQNTEQKIEQSIDKNVEFQQDEPFEASEFHIMGWEYCKWNNATLFLDYKPAWNPSPIIQRLKDYKNVKFYNNCPWLLPSRYMVKLCIYILHKNSSKRNVMKDNYHSNKFLSYFLVEFTKFLDGIISSISKVKYFCGKNLPTEEFWHEFQVKYFDHINGSGLCMLECSTSCQK